MSEYQIIRLSAPTLAGLKTDSLFCSAAPDALHVQPVADEVLPFVAFVRGGAALRGHKAVGVAAEQPQDVVGERNELARPHAAAVQVGFIVLQADRLPVGAADV